MTTMGKFDFVIVLLSFVFALALGHVLSRVGTMLVARERVKFSGLLTLAILNAVLQVFVDWLAMWDFRNQTEWDLFTISACFLMTVVVYFVCAASVPDVEAGEPVDMEAFYWNNYRLYYGLWLLLLIVYLVATLPLLQSNPSLALEEMLANLPSWVPVGLAFFVRARWAQWIAGVSLLVLTAAWPVVFSSVLH